MIAQSEAMSDFHQNYIYKSTETEKKGRKIKGHREEACRCFPPFVKFHYRDCPVAAKWCPIHGNIFRHGDKSEKIERKQNVIVSFHPSSKTERLLQPIKSLLAHCNSETKINFQYYSPGNSTSKENLKAQHGQNAYENLKKSFNNNTFVEKTKSFVTSKSSKVKKLKQCFHSPCNSIAQKTRSQTSIKEKLNQILREEAKQARHAFYNMVPEVPPNDTNQDPTSKWFYSNLKSFRDGDKPLDEKMDSDFITVTQRDKNNAINHKIFEIKHRKGLNEISFVGVPKQPTQLVYSTVSVGVGTINQTTRHPWYENKEEIREAGKNEEVYSTEKTQSCSSESSGSVYITPFLFLPKEVDDSDSDAKLRKGLTEQMDQAIQVEDLVEKSTKETSTAVSVNSVMIQTFLKSSMQSSRVKDHETNSILLQTESINEESNVYSRPICVHDFELQSETTVEEIYIGKDRMLAKRDFNDNSFNKKSDGIKGTVGSDQGPSSRYREVSVTARWDNGMIDQTSQTEDIWKFQMSVKALETRKHKSQNTMQNMQNTDRRMQTSFCDSTPEESEIIHVTSPNLSCMKKPFDEEDSDQTIDKIAKVWWGKSHSDSDLCERVKCSSCKGYTENTFAQSDFSKNSQINSAAEKCTFTKIYESTAIPVDSGPKRGSVTLKTKETIERFPDSKQTSTKEEEFSASVSDLGELKKIIQEFFEKRNLGLEKTCKCEKTKITEKTDGDTKEDSFIMTPKAEQKAEKFTNAFDQTQALPEAEKKADKETASIEVQTNVGLLLGEGEQQKHPNLKLRRTLVVVDDEDQSKAYFICAVCGRDIPNSVEATTNTDEAENFNEKKETLTVVGSEYTRTQIKMYSKNNQNPKSYKPSNTPSEQTEAKEEEKYPKSASSSSNKKSQIPVSVRFKNEKTQIQTQCTDILPPEWTKEQIHNTHGQHLMTRTLIECDCMPSTSTADKFTLQSSKSKDPSCHTRHDSHRSQPRPKRKESQPSQRNNSEKNRTQTYPLIFTPLWPKYFMKTWKSMDSYAHDNPYDSDPKSITSKQKRSYDKDLEATGAGKKLKVEFPKFPKEYSFRKPPLPGNTKKGKPRDFIIWPNSGLMAYHPTLPSEETSHSSTDEGNNEQILEKLQTRETSSEKYDDFLAGECASFYESNDTEQSSEGGLPEEEDEEVEEYTTQETGQPQLEIFSMMPKLKLQSLSAVFDKKSFYSDMTTSKSLNEFWLFRESKKNKRKFAKNLQNE